MRCDAAARVHVADLDPVIFMSGLDYDAIRAYHGGDRLGDGRVFSSSDFSFSDKIFFELHDYDNSATNCLKVQGKLYEHGFDAIDASAGSTAKKIAPVFLTEFGFTQSGTVYRGVYAQCWKESRIERSIG